MPLPSYVVELQFGASSYIDVTSYVQSISINRGISRVLDDYSAGSLSVTFVNNSRIFDPLNTSSPLWYGAGGYTIVQPAGNIRVSSNGVRRFTGVVQDWSFSFEESGFDGQATVTALDLIYEIGLTEFADQPGKYFDINYGIQAVVETSGDRIDRVFASNGFGASTYALVQSGKTIVGADVNSAGDSVLSYIQNVARSEPADLFSNASAVMVMKDRSFTNYTWANTTRNNLIAYPGTATSVTDEQLIAGETSFGWLWGGRQYTATPILSAYTNAATIDTNVNRYAMEYTDFNQYKYNPDGTATNFTFSAYFRGPALTTINGIFGDFYLLGDNGATIYTRSISATAVSSLDWKQITFSYNYSGTAIVSGAEFRLTSSGTTGSDFFIADGWILERASSYTNYFDGTTNPLTSSASTAYSVGWSGLAYQSYSGLVTSVASTATAPTVRTFSDYNSQSNFYGTAIPFTDLQVAYASEQLYNKVQVIGVNATAVVEDTVSQGLYGSRTYVQTDNLTTSITKPDEIASAFLGEFRLPEYRAEQLTVALEALTSAQQNIVLAIEIRDIVRVAFKPSNSGSSIDKYYQVLGISSNSDVERDAITFNLASLDNLPFRLNSTYLGVLNTDFLA